MTDLEDMTLAELIRAAVTVNTLTGAQPASSSYIHFYGVTGREYVLSMRATATHKWNFFNIKGKPLLHMSEEELEHCRQELIRYLGGESK